MRTHTQQPCKIISEEEEEEKEEEEVKKKKRRLNYKNYKNYNATKIEEKKYSITIRENNNK